MHRSFIIYLLEDTIYQYDTEQNNHIEIGQLPYAWSFAQLTYDARNEIIYIITPHPELFKFDLKTKKLTEHKTSQMRHNYHFMEGIVVNHDEDDNCNCYEQEYTNLDVLHIFANRYHAYYDEDKQKQIRLENHKYTEGRIIHIPSQKRILCMNKKQCLEFYTKSDECRGHFPKFTESQMEVPQHLFELDGSRIMNIYDTLLVFININKDETMKILFLDLITNKWFKTDANCPVLSSMFKLMDGRDNYLYFMNAWPYDEAEKCWFKINWRHVIPKELSEFYKETRYKQLIHGCVKEIEKRHNLYYNVPFYIKEMILKYYPCFLHF